MDEVIVEGRVNAADQLVIDQDQIKIKHQTKIKVTKRTCIYYLPTVCLEWIQVRFFCTPRKISTHISMDSYDENNHY